MINSLFYGLVNKRSNSKNFLGERLSSRFVFFLFCSQSFIPQEKWAEISIVKLALSIRIFLSNKWVEIQSLYSIVLGGFLSRFGKFSYFMSLAEKYFQKIQRIHREVIRRRLKDKYRRIIRFNLVNIRDSITKYLIRGWLDARDAGAEMTLKRVNQWATTSWFY